MNSLNIGNILLEWSWRVPDGMPSKMNPEHISMLRKVLESCKYSEDFINQFIFELTEAKEIDPRLKGKYVMNPKTKKKILATTALAYGADHPAFPAASALIKKPKGDNKGISKSKDGKEFEEPSATKKSELPKDKSSNKYPKNIIGDRDKTLEPVDTSKTKVFTSEVDPPDEIFNRKNVVQKINNPEPPSHFKFSKTFPGFKKLDAQKRFPSKYWTVLERQMNTIPSKEGKKGRHFTNKAGAGTVSSNAGEIITMMAVSMNDAEFNEFEKALTDHIETLVKQNPSLASDNKRIITKSWVQASRGQRNAILKRIRQKYGKDAQILNSAWDVPEEVEALGLSDYKKNKGKSSDIYLKIKTPAGIVLDEPSLKKSLEVKLLNSRTTRFLNYESEDFLIKAGIHPQTYKDNQRKRLLQSADEFGKRIGALKQHKPKAYEVLKRIEQEKGMTYTEALEKQKKQPSSDSSKVLYAGMLALAASGDSKAKKWDNDHRDLSHKYTINSIKALTENKKMRMKLLNDVGEAFPLKEIIQGAESMAFGEGVSLDKLTTKKIFGTDNFDEIKERLVAKIGPKGPYLGYQAKVGAEIIPIAKIEIREDGTGYKGDFRFDLAMEKSFANKVREADKAVYGE